MKKAAIFDLDGTIVFSEALHFEAFNETFAKYGATWTWNDFITKYTGTGSHNILKHVFEECGIAADATLIDKAADEKKDIYQGLLEQNRLGMVPGFFAFYEKVRAAGLKTAIASGTNIENILLTLKNVGMDSKFDAVLSGRDVPRGKPAPDVFLAAARALNEVPQNCVVFEDARSGTQAAKAAGMHCICLTTTTDRFMLEDAGADMLFPDFTAIGEANFQKIFA